MTVTSLPFSAILFDCDGVLVDSEPIVNKVFRQMLVELGWDISEQECMDLFIGKSFLDEWRIIHERTGLRIDQDWIDGFRDRRDAALARDLAAMPGAVAAVKAVAGTMGDQFACATGRRRYRAARRPSGHRRLPRRRASGGRRCDRLRLRTADATLFPGRTPAGGRRPPRGDEHVRPPRAAAG